jgi:hypothetical protein
MEQSYTTIDPWTYRDSDTLGVDVTRALELVGFEVEAIDGEIGRSTRPFNLRDRQGRSAGWRLLAGVGGKWLEPLRCGCYGTGATTWRP